MYEEFYRFIAESIIEYFLELQQSGELQKAESFCLKLDDDDMVQGVDKAIKEELKNKNIYTSTNIKCLLGDSYKATTAVLDKNKEIIIATQINGMSNDFLCATLRNGAKELDKSILMISSSLIDSAISGSRNMTASGMPFYHQNIMTKIQEMSNKSTQLTDAEKRIISFELKRRNSDAFSDKDSFYEYVDLLSVVSSGKIDNYQYKNFRLFPIKARTELTNFSEKQIDNYLKQNNELFEKISTSIKFSSFKEDFNKDFETSYINKLDDAIKKDSENWSNDYLYSDLLEAKRKKQKKADNPLVIESSNIEVVNDQNVFPMQLDKDYLIRKEGKQNGKNRKQSLIIFNSNISKKVYIQIECNASIKSNEVISKANVNKIKNNNKFIFEYDVNGLLFDRIIIQDSPNKIKYYFDLCILNISPNYLLETIQYNSFVDYKKKCIKLSDINSNITFNNSANNLVRETLQQNAIYKCNYDQRLELEINSKQMLDFEDGINIQLNLGGIQVPFLLLPDENGSEEITGKKLLREKYSNKQLFTVSNNMHMHRDSFEYFAKGNLLKELNIEKQIIQNNITLGTIKNLNSSEEIQINERTDEISSTVKEAYLEYLNEIKKNNSLPSLIYLDGELKNKAVNYIDTFVNYYNKLTNDNPLTPEQRNTLLIGSIVVGKNEEVWLTPLHPLNVAYQLTLTSETGYEEASDIIIDKLTSTNLFPYLKINNSNYKVSDQSSSLEWNYYAPIKNKKYRGSRKFIPKLVEDKINEYVNHFKYLFEEIENYNLKINLINMGDCSEVFQGIAQYYMHIVNRNPNYDNLLNIEINIYGEISSTNKFLTLKSYDELKQSLSDSNLSISKGISMSNLEGVLSKNISCYFHNDKGTKYEYAHISFYEMESNIMSGAAAMEDMETGISLNGLVSGIPSSKYGSDYRTGFGTKYSDDNSKLIKISKIINSVAQVGNTSNPYNAALSISTQIDNSSIEKMEDIYKSSNWVVFVEPKVDLSFFTEKEISGELLIIHYSDQYTTSSGYDAITITHKTEQYVKVIEEQLKSKGINCRNDDAASLINIFNSINGDWLLRLVSSISGKKTGTYFDREKISIAAAIKLMLAYLKHNDILWIPVSLEEMLRVSGGTALSSKDGVLSAKNLGFESGATSDDLLFVGFNFKKEKPVIYLYPVEVKTGINNANIIDKAISQAKNTYRGLRESFISNNNKAENLTTKIQRNFLMQLLITSCKKMELYHIDDTSNWDLVINKYRKKLLNDNFEISMDINEFLGNAAVLSFKKSAQDRNTSFVEDGINKLEFAESDEYGLILKSVSEIESELQKYSNNSFKLLRNVNIDSLTGDLSKISPIKNKENVDVKSNVDKLYIESNEINTQTDNIMQNDNLELVDDLNSIHPINNEVQINEKGMNIQFGTNQQNGEAVNWKPNDTDILFHTNTGIIGTMGTGKTQFTKSLVTQLYLERKKNIGIDDLGILIFDYKGDYNENHEDFVKATNAKVLKPYHLPINPFAIIKPKSFKPLLPMHVANTFRDTLCKIYNLGPKQQNTIFNCIKQAYEDKGIEFANSNTWDNIPPSFKNVFDIYDSNDEIKKGDSLSSVLSDLNNFELFEPNAKNAKALYDLLQGVVVIDLNGYDSKIQNLIVAIMLDLFYSNMQAEGSSLLDGKYRQMKKMILVDEADNFMSEDFPSLKKIMKEGREYGVGVVLSTQFLKHFVTNDGDYSKYILTWVVHNVSDLKRNEIDYIFRTDAKSVESNKLFNDIGKLEKHYSIVKIGNGKPIYMYDNAFWKLYKELVKN